MLLGRLQPQQLRHRTVSILSSLSYIYNIEWSWISLYRVSETKSDASAESKSWTAEWETRVERFVDVLLDQKNIYKKFNPGFPIQQLALEVTSVSSCYRIRYDSIVSWVMGLIMENGMNKIYLSAL